MANGKRYRRVAVERVEGSAADVKKWYSGTTTPTNPADQGDMEMHCSNPECGDLFIQGANLDYLVRQGKLTCRRCKATTITGAGEESRP